MFSLCWPPYLHSSMFASLIENQAAGDIPTKIALRRSLIVYFLCLAKDFQVTLYMTGVSIVRILTRIQSYNSTISLDN